jgi:diguanylate cyclase
MSRQPGTPHPVLLFVGLCSLAFAASVLQTAGTNWNLVAVAALTAAAVSLVAYLASSSRLVSLVLPLLPFVFDAILAMLRQAQGGSTSGYSPLAIIPVVWLGLTQRRRYLLAITGCTTLLLAVPILVVGAPMYPSSGWRGVVLWTVVALIVGYVVHRVVDAQRQSALLTEARAARLDRLVETQTTISTSDLDIDTVMKVVAEESLAIAGGDGACVELADGADVVCSAVAGTARPFLGMRLTAADTITGECFRTGRVLTCTDSHSDSRVSREACRAVGARSMIVVPLAHGGNVMGVLIVWSAAPHDFRGYESQLLELLATTSGAAMARVELVTQLTVRAATDNLTGLANRAAWHDRLEGAMARSRRSRHPLCVILLDLDGFKQVNDRLGHAEGDRVLKSISATWLTALRETDLLGRLGGDEFGVILEDADRQTALRIIARLDLAGDHGPGASAGLAVWDGHEDSAALIARADTCMYLRKKERAARTSDDIPADGGVVIA